MGIRAYDEMYLSSAQNILGHAVDFAVMTLDMAPDYFGTAFAVSDASKQFAAGNPSYVAGMSGCELVRTVLAETRIPCPEAEDAMYIDRSPEYWAGWALAFYQWKSLRSFIEILSTVPLHQIIEMYSIYHEMDILHFAEEMEIQMRDTYPQMKLRVLRYASGLSQTELSAIADVPLRQIQLFEQGQRDINKTSAFTIFKLSKALHCRMEDLIE